jgi:uncharacterized protein YebE (UPF0316 family)
MRFLLLLARLLRLPSPVIRPWANDVSVRRSLRRERRATSAADAASAEAPRPEHRVPAWRRGPGVVALLLAVAATIGALLVLLPPAAAAALATAVQIAMLRVTDVMLGVFRTTFIVRGRTLAASLAAFGESAAWIAAAGIVLADLTLVRGLAFATGVGIGTALGVIVVRGMRLGLVTVRVFAPLDRGHEVADRLRAAGQGATMFPGEGRDGPVAMVLSVMRRREADEVCRPFVDDQQLYVSMDAGLGPASRGRAGQV